MDSLAILNPLLCIDTLDLRQATPAVQAERKKLFSVHIRHTHYSNSSV